MIKKDEIIQVAGETGLRPNVVEKDYVLGWMLAGIHVNSSLQKKWVFKGGTCLKKCYFETYRFSEDLDFTILDKSHLNETFLIKQFNSVADWLYEQAGIEMPIDRFKFILNPQRSNLSCEARIYYKSYFASGKSDMPKVKLDLTADEVLVMPPISQSVLHNYTDMPEHGIFIQSYSYEEVFAEKIRALGERGRPRDLYDVINLYRNNLLPSTDLIDSILEKKCAFRNISVPSLQGMETYKEPLSQNWNPMLFHQLPYLPPLETYWKDLSGFFSWLNGNISLKKDDLHPITAEGEVLGPAYGYLGLRTQNGKSLEIIRFAAGNRLCVNLNYIDLKGTSKTCLIEPYSIRQINNGDISLYAVSQEDKQVQSYNISQIVSVSCTNQVFTPQYRIELNPTKENIHKNRLTVNFDSIGL